MRVGVVGCGGMGTTHLRALRSLKETMGVEVTAIADIRSMCRERAATVWPDARQYERAMDLIKEADVDWVHICLPSDLHAEHAIAALDAGRHVFIEKPVCLNGEDAKALLEAKKRSGKQIYTARSPGFPDRSCSRNCARSYRIHAEAFCSLSG